MRRENVEHAFAVGLPAARFDLLAEHDLFARRRACASLETEAAALPG